MTCDWRPPYAYVPGRTMRHPEDLFDAFKIIPPDADLLDCLPWTLGRAFARDGFYWEAHELWEAVWMACPPAGADKLAVQGAIQLVNAALKQRMGQPRAASRLLAQSDALLAEATRRDARLLLSEAESQALRQKAQGCAL